MRASLVDLLKMAQEMTVAVSINEQATEWFTLEDFKAWRACALPRNEEW